MFTGRQRNPSSTLCSFAYHSAQSVSTRDWRSCSVTGGTHVPPCPARVLAVPQHVPCVGSLLFCAKAAPRATGWFLLGRLCLCRWSHGDRCCWNPERSPSPPHGLPRGAARRVRVHCAAWGAPGKKLYHNYWLNSCWGIARGFGNPFQHQLDIRVADHKEWAVGAAANAQATQASAAITALPALPAR